MDARNNYDMAKAPRDGRVIYVGDDDVGTFAMRWNADATNSMFAPGVTGMWEAPDGSITWRDDDRDAAPTFWRHLPA
jgi:hypothetical protein